MPAHQSNELISDIIGSSEHLHPKEKTILIVDDEPDTVDLLQDILSDTYTISTANSGAKGMKVALTEVPDIILLDAWMPGITGYDVCRTLKKNPKTQHIPIIIITAAAGPEDQKAAIESGADSILLKPFENFKLIALIERILTTRGDTHV